MRASKPVVQAQGGPDIRIRPEQLRTIMRLAGWSTAELARQVQMDQSAVSRLLDERIQLGRRSIAGLLTAAYQQYGDNSSLGELFEEIFEVRDGDGKVIPTRRKPDGADTGLSGLTLP